MMRLPAVSRALVVAVLTALVPRGVWAGPLPVPAQASSPSTTEAVVLFDEGRRLMKTGQCEKAVERFAASQQLAPAPGTLLNLAECERRLERFASAWSHYRDAAALAATNDATPERAEFARRRAASLEGRLSRVRIRVAGRPAKGLVVHRDGAVVPKPLLGVAVPVDGGTVTVRARAPGYRSWSTTVKVPPEKGRVDVVVPLLERRREAPAPSPAPSAAAPRPAQPPRPAPPAPPPTKPAWHEPVGWTGVGVGVTALSIGGLVFGLSRNSLGNANCPDNVCVRGIGDPDIHERGRQEEQAAYGLFIAGGVLLGAGVTLIVLPAPAASTGDVRVVTRGARWTGISARF